MRSIRFVRPLLATVAMAALVVAGGCATRQPTALQPVVQVSPTPVWKIEVGDVIRTKVYREPDLSADAVVNEGGTAFFAGLGALKVVGMSFDALQAEVQSRYAKLIVDPAVDVQISREIVVYGQVRNGGITAVDQSTTVVGLLAKAGGANGGGRDPIMWLVKRDGRTFRLPRAARLSLIDIGRGDAVYVQDESWVGRNATQITTAAYMVGIVGSTLGLLNALTR